VTGCPAWCGRHEHDPGDPGTFLHTFEVGTVELEAGDLRVSIEQPGGVSFDGLVSVDPPSIELRWPGCARGDELPADPGTLDQVVRLLGAVAATLRASTT